MKRGIGDKRKSFITNDKLIADEVGSGIHENQGRSAEAKHKQKTISLAKLRNYQLHRASQAQTGYEPQGLFAKTGEDSDVPYISDNSAAGF